MNTVLTVSQTGTWVLDGVDTGVPVMGMLSAGANGNWYIDGVDTGTPAQGSQGPAGSQGISGIPGATGSQGPEGATPVITIGANGDWFVDGTDTIHPAQGPLGSGAIIPYASGIPVVISVLPLGLAGTSEFIGFGMSAPGLSVFNTTIDFTGGTLTNFAFNVPRNGYISDIAATFQVTLALALGMYPTFYLFRAPAGSSQYTQLPTVLTLPSLLGVTVGQVVHGALNNIDVPVSAGDQLLLVASGTGSAALITGGAATGYISAGIRLVYT